MLIVRDVFTAQPGQASKFAALFKKVMGPQGNVQVMTDLIGEFNTVVMEFEVENLSQFEQVMKEYQSGKMMEGLDSETAAAMKKYTEMYMTGRREIFRVID